MELSKIYKLNLINFALIGAAHFIFNDGLAVGTSI